MANKQTTIQELGMSNKVHLCNSCMNEFPTCKNDHVIFGDGVGNDNVCCCSAYKPLVSMLFKEKTRILHLNLKKKHWEEIRAGVKPYEFRLHNDYWKKRLVDREYDEIHIKCGYPKKDDSSKIIVKPYKGYNVGEITHDEFGDDPVTVFEIDVRG